MNRFIEVACTPRIVKNSIRIALVVGTIINGLNQLPAIISGAEPSWWHVIVNYIVPYCVATYSAVKNQMSA